MARRFTLSVLVLGFMVFPSKAHAEVQTTLQMTVPDMPVGYGGYFNATQTTPVTTPATTMSGYVSNTFSGLQKFTWVDGAGRLDSTQVNIANNKTRSGMTLDSFILFRSFISDNYWTALSSSTNCPSSSTSYNWVMLRTRTPDDPKPLDATWASFAAGGVITYDPSKSLAGASNDHRISASSYINLVNPATTQNTAFNLDALASLTPCTSGLYRAQAQAAYNTIYPFDSAGTFLFGTNYLTYVSKQGNPMMAIGVPAENISAAMSNFTSRVMGAVMTVYRDRFPGGQLQYNLYLTTANGTTFTLYSPANPDIINPGSDPAVGTLTCGSLNSPSNGFCNGTMTYKRADNSTSAAGKLLCAVSTSPNYALICAAQDGDYTSRAISIVAREPSTSGLKITLASRVVSVACPSGVCATTNITATLKNLSGRPITGMVHPGGGLGLTSPFTASATAFDPAGSCPNGNLAGNATCTVTIAFAPSTYGTYLQTYRVQYNNGAATVNASNVIIGTAGLSSIAVTAGAGSSSVGQKQQAVATATYGDSSTQVVNLAAAWSTSNSAVAKVSGVDSSSGSTYGNTSGFGGGLTSFLTAGSVNISASLGAVSGLWAASSSLGGITYQHVLLNDVSSMTDGGVKLETDPESILLGWGRYLSSGPTVVPAVLQQSD